MKLTNISFKVGGKTIKVPPNEPGLTYSKSVELASKKDLNKNPNGYMLFCEAKKGTQKYELTH